MSNRTLVFELLNDSSENVSKLTTSLLDIKESIFSNLYDAQKALTRMKSFKYKMSDCNKINNGYTISIPVQLIPFKNRSKFKASEYYKKKMCVETDINQNPEIFSNTLLVFINGLLYTNFRVEAYEDIAILYFMHKDGFRRDMMLELIGMDADITIVSVPIHREENNPNINKPTLINSKNSGVTLEDFTKNNGLDVSEYVLSFVNVNDKTKNVFRPVDSIVIPKGKPYKSCHITEIVYRQEDLLLTVDDIIGFIPGHKYTFYDSQLNTIGTVLLDNTDDGMLSFKRVEIDQFVQNIFGIVDEPITDDIVTTDIMTHVEDNTVAFSNVVATSSNKIFYNTDEILKLNNVNTILKNLYLQNSFQTIRVDNDDYFSLELQSMPIPVDNMLLFRVRDGQIEFDHDTTISLYYPNVYKINRTHSYPLVIYAYYTDDTSALGNYYDNEISLYHRFFYQSTIDERYNNDTIPELIKSYKPIEMVYNIPDYISKSTDHLIYKTDKLKNLIKYNGDNYQIYLDKIVEYPATFYIDIAEIDDIESRKRINNYSEIRHDTTQQREFDEECYLFVFRKDNLMDRMVIFIDNKYFFPKYLYSDTNYRYLYIPTRLINTESSIINIEKLYSDRYEQIIMPSSDTINDYVKLEYPKHKKICPSDIYLTSKETEGDKYLDKTDYEMYHLDNGEYKYIDNDSFYKYYPIYIKLLNSDFIGKTILVNVTNTTFTIKAKGTDEILINRTINNDPTNFLAFKNGLLIPSSAITVKFSEYSSGDHMVRVLYNVAEDDEIELLYTSNRYKRIYYQETINKKGIVNLTNKIDKPIDLRWHDIYLNGKKMQSDNVEVVAPYIIILHNVNSVKNLEIYQRNLDIKFVNSPKEWISIFKEDFENEKYTTGAIYNTNVNRTDLKILSYIKQENSNNYLKFDTSWATDESYSVDYTFNVPDSIMNSFNGKYSKFKFKFKLKFTPNGISADDDIRFLIKKNAGELIEFVSLNTATNQFFSQFNTELTPFYALRNDRQRDWHWFDITIDTISNSAVFNVLDENGSIIGEFETKAFEFEFGDIMTSVSVSVKDTKLIADIDDIEYMVWRSPVSSVESSGDTFYDLFQEISNELINPDIQQVTEEVLNKYPELFDENNSFLINPDDPKGLIRSYLINPDLNELSIMVSEDSGLIDLWSEDVSDDIYKLIETDILNDNVDKPLPDIIDSEYDIYKDIGVDIIEFFDRYLKMSLINPDIKQVTHKIIREFPDIVDSKNNIFLNPEDSFIITKNILFNPDESNLVILEREVEIDEQW